jgi:septum formation protein
MLHNLLQGGDIILASQSPRRAFLLKQIGLEFRQIPSGIVETENQMSPVDFVLSYSMKKAKKVFTRFPDSFVIGVDTIVWFNNQILYKPRDRSQAKEFLQKLSGNCHTVLSGVSICTKQVEISDVEKTKVYFNKISQTDIEEYLDTKEPFDKAGAYGIQGFGSQFIKKIDGCYFNVMGFPIPLFYKMCKSIFKEL